MGFIRFAAALCAAATLSITSHALAGPPAGAGSYDEFVALFEEFLSFKSPAAWNANFNDPNAPDHGLADYSKAAIDERIAELSALRARLDDV